MSESSTDPESLSMHKYDAESKNSVESVEELKFNQKLQQRATHEETEDDPFDTDLEIEVEEEKFNIKGEDIYLATCKSFGVVPASYFIRHMHDTELNMRHHGLGPYGGQAVSIPLLTNTSIVKLDLSDNGLEATGARYIAYMMSENCYIIDLDLSNNRIGTEGAPYICEMLKESSLLRRLNVSGNMFTDKDARRFAQAIMENSVLNELDLSLNNFGSAGGEKLGTAIGENETIETLNLSWNHLRRKGAVAVCDGIKVNPRLKRVDLSWNGLGNEGALSVAELLKLNNVLLELDISNNRITIEGAAMLAKGIQVNETLKVLKVGQNPIGSAGALILLNATRDERNVMVELHLMDILVSKEFAAIAAEMEKNRDIKITHGGILENFIIKGKPKKKAKVLEIGEGEGAIDKQEWSSNPALAIKTYTDQNNIQLVDLFKEFDKEETKRVSEATLREIFKKAGFALTEEHMAYLVNTLDRGDGESALDYSVFVS